MEPLSVQEINSAEKEILLNVQRQAFKNEHCTVQEKPAVKVTKTSPLHTLCYTTIKAGGLLCVGGRLKNAQIDDQGKHQIILPKKHHIVDLIVRFYHELSGHSGVEYVLSLIREKFWIVAVKRILGRCVHCKKCQAPVAQQMSDLPVERITPGKPPFSYVGVDCFGHFLVRRGRTQVKRYGVWHI